MNTLDKLKTELREYGAVSIVSGTLRVPDLLRAYYFTLRGIDVEAVRQFCADMSYKDATMLLDAVNNDEMPENEDDCEALHEMLTDLQERLDTIAADCGDYYFGPHVGDGADIGFWPMESE